MFFFGVFQRLNRSRVRVRVRVRARVRVRVKGKISLWSLCGGEMVDYVVV